MYSDSAQSQELLETSYAAALKKHQDANSPLVIQFSADWCSHCIKMKKEVFEPLAKSGELDQVSYVYLNIKDPANKNIYTTFKSRLQVNSLPLLVFLTKDKNGKYQSKHFVGGKRIDFIREEISKILSNAQ